MNSRKSYLDTLNTGRQRRVHSSLEELNRSMDALKRLDPHLDAAEGRGRRPSRGNAQWAPTDMGFEPRPGEGVRTSTHARGESSYQSIEREIDRYRRPDDQGAAAGKIASELKGLREELRHQMTAGLRREFDSLRKDIQRAYSQTGTAREGAELGAEFERLSGAIRTLSERSDDKGINMLRLELEQVKGAIDSLAREETVRSVGNRWDEFDRRWSSFEDRMANPPADPSLAALNARLEQINQAVNGLPESLSLRSLEEKVRMLAGAVEHFAHKQEDHGTGVLGMVEERLDEISRAIVASAATAQASAFDTEPFERIEARITSLAHQIEELMDDRPSNALFGQMELLARRIDEVASRSQVPEKAMERLAHQIADISDRLEHGQSAPDADHILRGIEQRFDMLSDVLDRRQGDAAEQSLALFRDLERRLDQVAVRLDQKAAAPDAETPKLMDAIDRRFADLAMRLEERAAAQPEAIREIEARLNDVASRLEAAPAQAGGFDNASIRTLEEQVAELSRNIARSGSSEMDVIAPRLDELERSISGQHDSILLAARQAAESAVRSLAGTGASVEAAAVTGLADDLKSLEALSRRSDERNTKTFEAIHDTLLKIVDRLGQLEQSGRVVPAPAMQAPMQAQAEIHRFGGDADAVERLHRDEPAQKLTPAQAAAAAASAALDQEEDEADGSAGGRMRSMFGGLTRALSKKERAEPVLAGSMPMEPTMELVEPDLDAPLDPRIANQPLEPGSGAPDLNAIVRKVRDGGAGGRINDPDTAKSDFIAAARRAAQAAAADAGIGKRTAEPGKAGGGGKLTDMLRTKRKPILMAAVALLVALAGMQLGKAFFRGGDAQVSQADAPPAIVADVAVPANEKPLDAAPPPVVDTAPAEAVRSVDALDNDPLETPAMSAVSAPVLEDAPMAEPVGEDLQATPVAAFEPAPVDAGPVALREAADGGDAKAMFEIASRYADGRGVKSDMAQAAKWYTRSAELGFAPAQYRIGNFNEKGIGVTRDVNKAKTWYQMAAEQGNASAMHNLAVIYAMGADGTADNDSAARWFTRAAELGVK
ncbi:MAG: peptidoglycan-binding protein, partial [Rhizobiaceae bacterium]